jgi:hypothetical protein
MINAERERERERENGSFEARGEDSEELHKFMRVCET